MGKRRGSVFGKPIAWPDGAYVRQDGALVRRVHIVSVSRFDVTAPTGAGAAARRRRQAERARAKHGGA